MKKSFLLVVALTFLAGCGIKNLKTATVPSLPHVPPSVVLAWNATPSAVDGYRLYRGSQTGGPYTLVGSVGSTLTQFADTAVTPGDTYFYVATAYTDNPADESVYSNEATTTVEP